MAKCGERYFPNAENAGIFVRAQMWNRATMEARINRRQSRLFLSRSALLFTALSPNELQNVMLHTQ